MSYRSKSYDSVSYVTECGIGFCQAYGSQLTVERALRAELPTSRMVIEGLGKQVAQATVQGYIFYLYSLLPKLERLTEYQLPVAAAELLEKGKALNPAEWTVFFNKLAAGEYEQFYGAVEIAPLVKSLRAFMHDRAMEQDKQERTKKQTSGQTGTQVLSPQETVKVLSEWHGVEFKDMGHYNQYFKDNAHDEEFMMRCKKRVESITGKSI